MSLRHALLALISAEPMTGYTAAKHFESTVGFTWYAPSSQIYPELRRLEADGLLAASELRRGANAKKREYRLTEEGEAELRRWITDLDEPQRERDVARLRAGYFDMASASAIRDQLRAHAEHYRQEHVAWNAMLEHIESRSARLIARRIATRPPCEHDEIVAWKVYAYRGLVARAQMEIAWAEDGLELLEQLRPGDQDNLPSTGPIVGPSDPGSQTA